VIIWNLLSFLILALLFSDKIDVSCLLMLH